MMIDSQAKFHVQSRPASGRIKKYGVPLAPWPQFPLPGLFIAA